MIGDWDACSSTITGVVPCGGLAVLGTVIGAGGLPAYRPVDGVPCPVSGGKYGACPSADRRYWVGGLYVASRGESGGCPTPG